MILVDTNVWSELAKPRGNAAVLSWLEANDADLALSALVIAEIQYGIELPDAAHKRPDLEQWLAGLEARYRNRTLVFGPEAARHYGHLAARPEVKQRKPQIIDMQIAAQAQAHAIPIATRNAKDFEWIGVELIDPWKAGSPSIHRLHRIDIDHAHAARMDPVLDARQLIGIWRDGEQEQQARLLRVLKQLGFGDAAPARRARDLARAVERIARGAGGESK